MRKFSIKTPDLGKSIGRSRTTEHRLMGGMSRITEGEMMNAKKIAIKIFEGEYLRSSIKDMQNVEVRIAKRIKEKCLCLLFRCLFGCFFFCFVVVIY